MCCRGLPGRREKFLLLIFSLHLRHAPTVSGILKTIITFTHELEGVQSAAQVKPFVVALKIPYN